MTNRKAFKLRCLLVAVSLCALTLSARAQQKLLVCFGDSITAGYGLDDATHQAYPAILEKLLHTRGYNYRVANQGVSGNTTKDAVSRVQSIVAMHPDAVLLEFGGNDGLRGLSMEITRKNLTSVVSTLTAAHIRVLLAGITLPPNYGADYIQSFNAVFRDVAKQQHIPLLPMLYEGVYQQPNTIQSDGIHPTAKGSELIAQHMLPSLLPLLHK